MWSVDAYWAGEYRDKIFLDFEGFVYLIIKPKITVHKIHPANIDRR